MREAEVSSWSIQWTSIITSMKPPGFLYLASVIHYNHHFWFPTQTFLPLQSSGASFRNTGPEPKHIPRQYRGRFPSEQRRGLLPTGGGEHSEGLPSSPRHSQSQGLSGVRNRRGWGGEDWMFSAEGDKISLYFSGLTAAFCAQPSRSCEVVGVLLQLIQ